MSTKAVPVRPEQIGEVGEEIYRKTLKEKLESSNMGEYVAIDVLTGKSYLGKYGEIALMEAREKCPHGVFYLVRIGQPVSLGVRYVGSQ